MKKKILTVIFLAAAAIAAMTVSASACRQGPLWDGGILKDTYAGEIYTGDNKVTITGDECKIYSFTPEFSGCYEMQYSRTGCVFMDIDNESGCYYEYLISSYEIDGVHYSSDIYNFEAGNTYMLYIADEEAYESTWNGGTAKSFTDTITLNYLGKVTDFEILDTCYEICDNGSIDPFTDEGDTAYRIYTTVNAEFENGTKFFDCSLYGNSCGMEGIDVAGEFYPNEGTNTITLSLYGYEKDFEIYCTSEMTYDDDEEWDDAEVIKNPPERNITLFSLYYSGRDTIKSYEREFNSAISDLTAKFAF